MKPFDLQESLKKAEEELMLIDKAPFTNDGFQEFKQSISSYIKNLLIYSVREANHNDIKNVSAAHVKSAAQFLIKFRNDKWKDFNNSLSGILLGLTISNIYTYGFTDTNPTVPGLVFTLVCGIAGAYMFGVNFRSS
jgi:hypothetical protein